jgi:hypothetical protein
MKKLNPEIIDLLSENMSDAVEGPKYSDVWADPMFQNFKMSEEAHYGGEGKGSEYWTIFKLTDKETNDDFFIKFDGYYASYSGTDWETVSQVVPVDKTVVDWKEVK